MSESLLQTRLVQCPCLHTGEHLCACRPTNDHLISLRNDMELN